MVSQLHAFGNTAELDTIIGKLHALQYAAQAYQPSVDWLIEFLGPIHGILPAVPDNTGGLPMNPNAC